MLQPKSLRPALLEVVRCPQDRTELFEAGAELLVRLNRSIAKGCVSNVGGETVRADLTAGLVRQDGKIIYPVVDGIPKLLVDEGMDLGQLET